MRLNKFLAQEAHLSRRAADAAITQGRVTIDGIVATLGAMIDPAVNKITLNQKLVEPQTHERLFLAYYKPRGVECTLSKEANDGLAHHLNFSERVYPIGRLDKYSEGLLLLTNDGDFAFQLGHPRFGHEKVYHVTLNAPLTEAERKALASGVVLDDGEETRPCRIEHVQDTTYRWVLVEGKNRQIRRMAAIVDLTVKKLVRVSFGGLPLGDLRPGGWRALTETEKACLLDAEMRALVANATTLAPPTQTLSIIKPKPAVVLPNKLSTVRSRVVINPRLS